MMAADRSNTLLTARDFQSTQINDWCAGCGDHGILRGLEKALALLGIGKDALEVVPADAQGRIQQDHLPLLDAGIRAIDVIDMDYPYHHTTEDTLDKVSAESLLEVCSGLRHEEPFSYQQLVDLCGERRLRRRGERCHAGDAAPRQDNQLRNNLRHERLWPRPRAFHRKGRGAALHR